MLIRIDPEFKALIPPLKPEESEQLEKNIIAEGCRDALVLWNGTLIDGHNRHEICTKNNIAFSTTEIEFESRDDAINWIIDNQLGRRNITREQRDYLLGLRYRQEKKNVGEHKGNQYTNKVEIGQNVPIPPTAQAIAEQQGVSEKTVKRAEKFADGLDKIAHARPEMKDQILQGKSDFKKQDIQSLAKIDDEKVEAEVERRLKEIEAEKNRAKEEKARKQEMKKLEYLKRVEEKKEQPENRKVDILATDKKFRVIYADPCWSYNDKQETPMLGGASKHYETMTINQLAELPVNTITEKDAVLFLWVTSPLLEECFEVIKAWGFKYKTSFVWDKVKHNMGHYNSVRHELLLVATKGSCTPDKKKLYDSVQSIERNDRHSEKPKEFMDIIDDIYEYGDRLEMFARDAKKENWYVWGDEV